MSRFHFKDLWITTIIQQKEDLYGPIEDRAIMVELQSNTVHKGDINDQIIRRAYLLAKRDGFLNIIQQWSYASKLALLILFIIAGVTGLGLAFGALDNQQKHINILFALVTLLGLHTLALLLWIFSFFTSWKQQSFLGRCWLWLSQKIARSSDTLLAMQSFIQTCNQQNGMRWIVGTISHGFWLITLCMTTITWLILLAGKQFSFGWETTILSTHAFISLTHLLGIIPAQLGFPTPDAALIAQSSNHFMLSADAQKIWSLWLTGELIVWGVLLRLFCFLGCFFKARLALNKIHINTKSTSYLALLRRLQYQHIQTDTPCPNYYLPKIEQSPHHQQVNTTHNIHELAIGIDLPMNISLPSSLSSLIRIESREERHQLLSQISQSPITKLLVICDGTQTPDRGTAYFIREISQYTQHVYIYLHIGNENISRLHLWKKSLNDMGIATENIWYHPQQLDIWSLSHPENTR